VIGVPRSFSRCRVFCVFGGERGELNCQETPVHQRLLRSDIEALTRPHKDTRAELRSLWLNRAVVKYRISSAALISTLVRSVRSEALG
jgi:hypothetical protein